MQKRYGVIDIGSNTVVLLIYAVDGPNIQKENYLVTAAHLVQYVNCGHMSLDGIHRAAAIVEQYKKECEKAGVSEIHADITACGRGIDNGRQLVNAIANTGITSVRILSGEEEAACDFYGTSFDRRISEGLLIDVGGGSTEFVAFRDNQIIDQASIPLGCVRLRRMPYYIDGITPVLKELKEAAALTPEQKEGKERIDAAVEQFVEEHSVNNVLAKADEEKAKAKTTGKRKSAKPKEASAKKKEKVAY